MNGEYLQEAIRIGDQLLTATVRGDHGVSWKTPDLDADGAVAWGKSEDLYTGASGIALFLTALYRETADKKYLHAAVDAMSWIDWYCKQHLTDNYALISGRMGVSFTYLKLYEATSQKVFLAKALHHATGSLSFLTAPHVNDFINGISGTTLGLLHLYAATNEPWVLGYIQKYVDRLLYSAHVDKAGLYWDSYYTEVQPLCGFSHGPSGIGFVFLELGNYFNNPAFYQVADKAFAYEDQYFDKSLGNWPDFRLDMFTKSKADEFETEFKEGNTHIFEDAKDTNAWCHGAVGIGMARLRALSLYKDAAYKQDVKRALDKTVRTSSHSFTLCHGNAGNADLFLEYYLQHGDKAAQHSAVLIATRAIEQRKLEGTYASGLPYTAEDASEDLSLFNGVAGIGYFMLRIANPGTAASLLVPRLNAVAGKGSHKLTNSAADIQKKLLNSQLPQTLHNIEQYAPQAVQQYFQDTTVVSTGIASFTAFIRKVAASLPEDERQSLDGALTLDLVRIDLQQRPKNSGMLYVAEKIKQETANKLLAKSDEALFKQQFRLSSEVKLIAQHNAPLILKRTPLRVEEQHVNPFCYLVLSQFAKPVTATAALNSIEAVYKPKTPAQKQLLKEKTTTQVRELIAYCALLPTK